VLGLVRVWVQQYSVLQLLIILLLRVEVEVEIHKAEAVVAALVVFVLLQVFP
jgi:hypothetical protein